MMAVSTQKMPTWNSFSSHGWNSSAKPSCSAVSVGTTPSTNSLGISSAPPTVEITVGAVGGLSFNPESVTVIPGTVLRFDFLGTNHTLTQSSLKHPCVNSSHFDTGFNQFNPKNVSGRFLVDYVVRSNASEWFYCAQSFPTSHCEAGMLFSVNPGNHSAEFSSNAQSSSLPSSALTTAGLLGNTTPPSVTLSASVSNHPTRPIVPQSTSKGTRRKLGLLYLMVMVPFALGQI